MKRRLLAAVVVVLSCAGCGATGGPPAPVSISGAVVNKGNEDHTAQANNVTLTVTMGDDWFSPTFIKVAPGARLTITLSQEGEVAHTFTIDGQQVDVALSRKASTKTVAVTGPSGGHPLVFYCKYHQSSGMQGAIYPASTAAPTPSPTPSR